MSHSLAPRLALPPHCLHFDQGVAHESVLGLVYYFIKLAVFSNKTARLRDQMARETNVISQDAVFKSASIAPSFGNIQSGIKQIST